MSDRTPRILVVDDDAEIVDMVKILLSTKGYTVDSASDGHAGLEQLRQAVAEGAPYHLAIVDLRMPRVSGLQFCKQVRGDHTLAATPLLAMSGMGSEINKPDQFWAEGLGSDDFMAKPFDILSLIGRVEALLRKSMYVSQGGPSGSGAQAPGGSGAARASKAAAGAYDPADPVSVVRAFIESWNIADFPTEADTLSEEMLGGLDRAQYAARRSTLWHEEGDARARRVAGTVTLGKVTGNVASVQAMREDIDAAGRPMERKDERFTLRRTSSGWKIVNVRSRPLADTPTPVLARVETADSLEGAAARRE